MLKDTRFALAIVLALVAAGCGGAGGAASAVTSRLNITPAAGYNGTTAPLETGNAATVSQNGHTIATVSSGGRTLVVNMVATEIHAGDTFDIGADGTTAVYTEVKSRDDQTFTWVGTGGRVTIDAVTGATQATIDVSGVNFQADGTIDVNPALGSFTLNGHVNGIPISGGGGIGGQATLSFSSPTNTNADLSPFDGAVIAYAEVQSNGTLAATVGTGDNLRVLSVILSQNAAAGDVVNVGDPLNGKIAVTFSQGASAQAKVWVGSSGAVKVVSRTATTAKVQFTNVKFVAPDQGSATGSFVLNGSLARRP
ncbi:hypothetical protein OP10G_1915 [Fimbriimonas ginsengisoli Gsoil 348]|uniref:DUF5666 domain-containing protein n=1 Tax=Fimbriimonas ginsengisoli Gsoil 348 TaxID=661478 RepID=A0A068NNZ1_FIMGI|nr:hypothetical protein OP10G_1915 [Fimbriimonas ginsengisoli Gsoil 348]